MKLQASKTEPGLFSNPDWRAGDPGTFAVIIGVSRYPYLAGGDDPARETYSLGQLAVSALTAYEWFRWLTTAYTFAGAPLAKCWLLVSPTKAEREFAPELADGLAEPTFDNCRKALGYWWDSMRQLPAESAAKSRALFFFSGHGIEIYQDKQILLPSDFLCPPARSWNDAISTENVRRALASLNVPQQFFFLDACRNGAADLRRKVIQGANILNEDDADSVNPDLIAPLLFATSSGQQAFQQQDPSRGLSLFGTALLDGLNGKPEMALERVDPDYVVRLYALQSYVKLRVRQLLSQAGETVLQPVKMSGVVDDATVTFLKAHTVRASRAGVVGGFGREVAGPAPCAAAPVQAVPGAPPGAMPPAPEPVPAPAAAFAPSDRAVLHDPFGPDAVADIWRSANVQAGGLGARISFLPALFHFGKVTQTPDKGGYQVELQFSQRDPVGYWLQVGTGERSWGCALPGNGDGTPVRYLLEFDVSFDRGKEHRLTRLEASLALSNAGALGEAARLWRQYRNTDLGAALLSFERDGANLRQSVLGKPQHPLAALVAATVLMRAKTSRLKEAWLRDLAASFPWIFDSSVLLAEHLLRNSSLQESQTHSAAAALTEVQPTCLPFTSEAFAYLSKLTGALLNPRFQTAGQHRRELARLRERLDNAVPFLRPGGLFTTYGELDGTLLRTVVEPGPE